MARRLFRSPHPGASGGEGQTKPCSGHYSLRKTDEHFECLTKIITAMMFATATDGCKKQSLRAYLRAGTGRRWYVARLGSDLHSLTAFGTGGAATWAGSSSPQLRAYPGQVEGP